MSMNACFCFFYWHLFRFHGNLSPIVFLMIKLIIFLARSLFGIRFQYYRVWSNTFTTLRKIININFILFRRKKKWQTFSYDLQMFRNKSYSVKISFLWNKLEFPQLKKRKTLLSFFERKINCSYEILRNLLLLIAEFVIFSF